MLLHQYWSVKVFPSPAENIRRRKNDLKWAPKTFLLNLNFSYILRQCFQNVNKICWCKYVKWLPADHLVHSPVSIYNRTGFSCCEDRKDICSYHSVDLEKNRTNSLILYTLKCVKPVKSFGALYLLYACNQQTSPQRDVELQTVV